MFNESYSLLQEFPEFKEQIHALKINDAHFARLFDEYEAVCKQVHRIEQEIDKVSDILAEKFKKQRLALKDELYSMLTKAAA
ncbi:MAG: YdcH family protein [Alphaproteobacteria bacterium]|nr:YdcH family protein [Alphaproteobacteria bacterium]